MTLDITRERIIPLSSHIYRDLGSILSALNEFVELDYTESPRIQFFIITGFSVDIVKGSPIARLWVLMKRGPRQPTQKFERVLPLRLFALREGRRILKKRGITIFPLVTKQGLEEKVFAGIVDGIPLLIYYFPNIIKIGIPMRPVDLKVLLFLMGMVTR